MAYMFFILIAIVGIGLTVNFSSAATVYDVNDTNTNSEIQNIINGMSDGDTLFFNDGIFENIGLIINKTINITGSSNALIKAIVDNSTLDTADISKYAIDRAAAFYFVNGSNNSDIYGLNITSMPGFDYLTNSSANSKNTLIYALRNTNNVSIHDNVLNNSAWGIYLAMSTGATTMSVYNNIVTNMADTGIINFGSGAAIINNNTISNVGRHGIDIRHGSSANSVVSNNIITNASEGIYTMHSGGHIFLNNTIINTTLSAITAYGAFDVLIQNNTMKNGIIGILLSSSYSNITLIGNNFTYTSKSTSPNFGYNLVTSDSANSNSNVDGTYSDSSQTPANISIKSSYEKTTITNGQTVMYTVSVANTGKGAGSNISIANILPVGVNPNSVIVSKGTFSNGTWTIDSLSSNSNAILVFSAKPSKSGTFTNTINATYNDNLNKGNYWVDISGVKTTLKVNKDIKLSSSNLLSANKVKKAKYFYITTQIKNTGLDNSSTITSKIATTKGLKIAAVSKSSYASYNKNSKTWTIKKVPSKKTITLKMKVQATKKGTQKVKITNNGKSEIKSVKVV
ncbi:right-handed parallel beta-helix repeat-containing protein [Methanobrevibacter sp. TMH8]|nr:right-handed parallel beta-helix repeat-containing protein [Methanobrevibacter sp. TMH8]